MSTPIPPKFLLDENVRRELFRFLKAEEVDVKLAPRTSGDSFLSSLSLSEKRVVVTNDADFCEYAEDEIWGVVWLRIPQNNPRGLIAAFKRLLIHEKMLAGRLIILELHKESDFLLSKKFRIDKKPE